ncbi:MAG: hypothetical protein K2Y33_21320, partial [Mycolicibacterium frederiksbergense]|nr:hypothetical protein [Mycolicibacterium frederiksbergense]
MTALWLTSNAARVLALRTSDDAPAAQRLIEPLFKQYFPDAVLELKTAASLFGLAMVSCAQSSVLV